MSSGHYDPTISPNKAKLASFLCYVNGLLVPVLSVQVQTAVRELPTGLIEFYPSPLLMRLGAEDRVEVVIFYLDHYYEPENPAYRLLFEGEIVAWNYASSGEHRSITATAVADLSILQQIQFSLLNTVDAVATNISTPGSDAATVTDTTVFYGYSIFQNGLVYPKASSAANPNQTPTVNITRPFDILQNTLKAITSKEIPANSRSLPVINFYSRWARRRNFPNRFVACPDFDDPRAPDEVFPILRAAKVEGVLQALQDDIVGPDKQGASLYEILSEIYQSLYFEIATLMTPPAVRVRPADGVIVDPDAMENTSLRLANYYTKPYMMFAIPPSCNVLFPSMVKSISYTENYREQPTRVYMLDSTASQFNAGQLATPSFTMAYPPAAQAHIDLRRTSPKETGKNMLVWPEEFFRGPQLYYGNIPFIYSILVRNWGQSKKAASASSGTSDKPDEAKEQDMRTLLGVYAKYEYFRTRYGSRTGAADLVFNPYVVPGYPMVLFDRPGGLNQVGYVHTVSHTLTPTTFTTAINYTAGRTLNEWTAQIEEDVLRSSIVLGSAPADPFEDVREVTQDFTRAENHYQTLFHGRRPLNIAQSNNRRKASFDVREVIRPATSEDARLTITDDGRVQTHATGEYAPTPEFENLFKNSTAALTYTARPICTLEEYILFRHGETDLTKVNNEVTGTKQEPSPVPGVSVYGRIVKLKPVPQDYTPDETITGAKINPPVARSTDPTATANRQPYTALNALTYQTRADWDYILEAYRDEVLKNVAPLE